MIRKDWGTRCAFVPLVSCHSFHPCRWQSKLPEHRASETVLCRPVTWRLGWHAGWCGQGPRLHFQPPPGWLAAGGQGTTIRVARPQREGRVLGKAAHASRTEASRGGGLLEPTFKKMRRSLRPSLEPARQWQWEKPKLKNLQLSR